MANPKLPLTSEDIAADQAQDISIGNINELETQIGRTPAGLQRDILIGEHNRIKGQIPQSKGSSFNDFKATGKASFGDFEPVPPGHSKAAFGNQSILRWAKRVAGPTGESQHKPSDADPTPALKEAASIADMVLSYPGQAYAAARGVGDTTARLLFGEGDNAYKEGNKVFEELANYYNPQIFTKILQAYEKSPQFDPSNIDKFMSGLSKFVEDWDRNTTEKGGPFPPGSVKMLANVGMVALGGKGAEAYFKERPYDAVKAHEDMGKLKIKGPPAEVEKPNVKGPPADMQEIPPEAPPKPAAKPRGPGGKFAPKNKDISAELKKRPDLVGRADLETVAGVGVGSGAIYLGMTQDNRDSILAGAATLAAIPAIKLPGGMWHPEAIERIASPLRDKIIDGNEAARWGNAERAAGREGADMKMHPSDVWATKAVKNYLNKYAGTERDPLKKVEIPFEDGVKTWEEVTDNVISKHKVRDFVDENSGEVKPEFEHFKKAPSDETVYSLQSRSGQSGEALLSYLSHVGDYLRQNVKADELSRYDLVRAVKETAENDKRVAKEMEKAQAAATKDLPVHKEYPDGFRWVELKLPEKLTEEQAKRVRKATRSEIDDYFTQGRNELPRGDEEGYAAIGTDGKPIKNNYTGEKALGPTPEEAFLAGQLAQEGNVMGHCVGGYCAGVASGESKIYSLRDKQGRSHVTVEVRPFDARRLDRHQYFRARTDGRGAVEGHPDITQIKGKQNRAPNKEYQKYVQDFVRSGKWGQVDDLANAGLFRYGKELLTVDEALPRAVANIERRIKELNSSKVMPERSSGATSRNIDQLEHNLEYLVEYRSGTRKELPLAAMHFGMGLYDEVPKGREAGFVDPQLLKRVVGLGFGIGAGLVLSDDNKTLAALMGGAAGLVAVSPVHTANLVRKAFAPDTRIRIDALTHSYDASIVTAARAIFQAKLPILEKVPSKATRAAINSALEVNDLSQFKGAELEAAKTARTYFREMHRLAQRFGIDDTAHANYVRSLWQVGMQQLPPVTPGKIPKVLEGKALGLTPVAEDVTALMSLYGKAISSALANHQLVGALKATTTPAGAALAQSSITAPPSYVPIGHPMLVGLRVHPDIEASVKFIFTNYDPSVISRGLEGLNTLSKRTNVSFSLFHAKALGDAYIGAMGPIKGIPMALVHMGQSAAPKLLGEHTLLKQLREGGAGDMADTLLKGGLKISFEAGATAVEDVTGTFYSAMRDLQHGLDKVIPGAGKAAEAFTTLNHAVDTFMWARLHAGMKLAVAADKFTKLVENGVPRDQAAKIASDFTNSTFGGLNWRRIAEGAKTKWGRDLGLAAYNPVSRRVMQLLLFAPDWTISTTRAATQAFADKPSLSGLLRPKTLGDLHRQYVLRSALYYVTVADAINYQFSGHHIWDNEDPTTVDMGDGRKMQWSKHIMEPVHWLTKPGQQGLNKLGLVPREAFSQATGKEYLTTSGNAPPIKSRIGHLAKNFSPISVQQWFDPGTGSGAAGFLGAPIYGRTYKQRQEDRLSKMGQGFLKDGTAHERALISKDMVQLYKYRQDGDIDKYSDKLQEVKEKYKLNHSQIMRIQREAKTPPQERAFRALPPERQEAQLRKMPADQREHFLQYANTKIKKKFRQEQ